MALSNHERVGKAMELLRLGLGSFVEREIENRHGEKADLQAPRISWAKGSIWPANPFSTTIRRVARTIYLGSAPTAAAAHRGIEDRCVATYLYQDGPRAWYSTHPTVTTLPDDRAEQLKRDPDAVMAELDKRLRSDLQKRGDFVRIHPTISALHASAARSCLVRSSSIVVCISAICANNQRINPAHQCRSRIPSGRLLHIRERGSTPLSISFVLPWIISRLG